FRFHYLPSDKFNIYVLPNDYSKKYDDSTKMFAFYNTAVNPDSNNQNVKLYAYQQEKPKEKPSTITPQPTSKKGQTESKNLRITTNLENNEQDILGDLEITFNRKITKFDSSKVS